MNDSFSVLRINRTSSPKIKEDYYMHGLKENEDEVNHYLYRIKHSVSRG